MNDWYKNGRLPPIGAEVWAENIIGVVVALPDAGNTMVCVKRHDGWLGLYNYKRLKPFRPLQTETDKLVEQMVCDMSDADRGTGENAHRVARSLVEQGYRKIKPMSEDEFVAAANKHAYRGLYRAGCRFIEQGEHNE